VDNKESLPPVPRLKILPEVEIGGPLALILCGDRKQTHGFDYNQEVIVFEKDSEAASQPSRRSARPDFQDVPRQDLPGGQVAGLTVHTHAALGQHLTQSSLGSSRDQEQEGIEKRA
jgi:hypothetical protein